MYKYSKTIRNLYYITWNEQVAFLYHLASKDNEVKQRDKRPRRLDLDMDQKHQWRLKTKVETYSFIKPMQAARQQQGENAVSLA